MYLSVPSDSTRDKILFDVSGSNRYVQIRMYRKKAQVEPKNPMIAVIPKKFISMRFLTGVVSIPFDQAKDLACLRVVTVLIGLA